MALWDKVRQELDRAGKIAQGALDEGKVRLEAFRARQRADQAAQALGYAVYRARQQGQELDSDTYARLSSALAGHEAEAAGLETRLSELGDTRRTGSRPADVPPASSTEASAPGDVSSQGSAPQSTASTSATDAGAAGERPPA
jgi:hypothetical protein